MNGKFVRNYLDGIYQPKDMNNISKMRKIRSRHSEAVDGGNGTQLHQDRIKDLLELLSGKSEIESNISTADNYGGKGLKVSIEREGAKQMEMQKKLDKQVQDENVFPEAPAIEHGLPPCKRVDDEGEIDHSSGRKR